MSRGVVTRCVERQQTMFYFVIVVEGTIYLHTMLHYENRPGSLNEPQIDPTL